MARTGDCVGEDGRDVAQSRPDTGARRLLQASLISTTLRKVSAYHTNRLVPLLPHYLVRAPASLNSSVTYIMYHTDRVF